MKLADGEQIEVSCVREFSLWKGVKVITNAGVIYGSHGYLIRQRDKAQFVIITWTTREYASLFGQKKGKVQPVTLNNLFEALSSSQTGIIILEHVALRTESHMDVFEIILRLRLGGI